MSEEGIKTGIEILNDYFSQLSQNANLDSDLVKMIKDLWEQKRLSTSTYLEKGLDSLIEKKIK